VDINGSEHVGKIIEEHLQKQDGQGRGNSLRVDQTLAPDSTGPMAFWNLKPWGFQSPDETLDGLHRPQLDAADFESPDDHRFCSRHQKYGAYCSKAGNGIQHHCSSNSSISRTGVAGADKPYATAGGLGMLAIGVGRAGACRGHGRRPCS
jgi:homoaconitase/3-isopropylmalate dehydratase large subunit